MKYKWGKLEDYDEPQEEKPSEESDYSFIQEKIKDRPINRRRLAKRMLLTAGMAIIFGFVACLSFLVLEPALADFVSGKDGNDIINEQQIMLPEVEIDYDTFTKEDLDQTVFAETPIDDMNYDDTLDASASDNTAYETVQIIKETYEYEVSLDDYQLIYKKMGELSKSLSKSLVTVTCIEEDTDILNESYENFSRTTGIIITENLQELFILADATNMKDDGQIQITFNNDSVVNGTLKNKNPDTNLAVYSVDFSEVDDYTKQSIAKCKFGSSYTTFLLGSPVIAMGDPLATNSSICYGAVTSMDTYIYDVDARYQVVTTDIYGSRDGNGFLFNMRGQLVGVITQDHHSDEMKNMVYVYGISSVKSSIEDIINDRTVPVVGIVAADVAKDIRAAKNMPEGIFVSDVLKDSPSMNGGILPGDIIQLVNGTAILSVNDYLQVLRNVKEGDNINVVVARSNGEEYINLELELTTDENN